MNISLKDIRKNTKNRVNNNFGDSFIIVFVPFFLMNAFNIVLSQISMYLPEIIEFYIDLASFVFLNIFAFYLSFKLLIQYVSKNTELTFNNFFDVDNGFINFISLQFIIAILIILMHFPVFPVISEMATKIQIMGDPNAIERYLSNSDIIPRLISTLKSSAIFLIIFWLLTIRFQMVPFLIVDKKVTIIEAVKMSYQMTRGHYFKILLFPFTYLLWYLLIFTFIGFFYVIPLIFMGYGYLYKALSEK